MNPIIVKSIVLIVVVAIASLAGLFAALRRESRRDNPDRYLRGHGA